MSTANEIQWRNIKKVVRAAADLSFGGKDDPKYGHCWLAVVNSLTASDGIDITALGLEPLPTLETAQPVQVNAMLVEALQAAEKLEHEALVALSEATYELKVGNTYTTATDTYKANNDLIRRLDKILNSQYRDRKRAALTAAQQAQPVCGYDDETGNCTRVNCCKQAQPEPVEQPIEALQKLGARLAALLDEDQWVECEALLIQAGAHQ